MKSIRSVRRDRPITRNIISGRVKDVSIVIAAIELFNALQLTFICQLMLHELTSPLLQVLGIVCSVEVHGVRLSHGPLLARTLSLASSGECVGLKWSPITT